MAAQQPLLGKTLGGRYQITGHIGEGAMASVFRARDVSMPGAAEVAIKVMHPHLADDRTFAARFKQEARAASMVRHAHSVAIFDVGVEDGMHYIVMELVRGRDLKDTLKLEGRLEPARAARIISAICEALHAAHQLGVVHRDLKPENVMVEPGPEGDRVKVLDFGIAKLVEQKPRPRDPGDSEPPVTQFGVVVGTPAYMSPEQCRGQPLDGRSDIYTCGILLYQLVTGRVPFHSDSPFEIAGKQAFEPPPPPRTHRPDLSPELEALILKTLAKSPAERPESATALRDALTALIPSLEGRAPAAPRPGLAGMSKTVPLHAMGANLDEALKAARAAAESQAPVAPAAPAASPLAVQAGPFGMQPGPFAPSSVPSAVVTEAPRGPLGTAVDARAWGLSPSGTAPAPLVSAATPGAGAPGAAAVTPSAGAPALVSKDEARGSSGALAALWLVLALLGGVGVGWGLYKLVG